MSFPDFLGNEIRITQSYYYRTFMVSENDIIKGCRDFNPHAQQLLYKKYVGQMRVICVRYALDREEAKDMLQEGFIKIFSQIHQFAGTGSLEGWMKRIMVNTAISFYNKNKKYRHESIEELLAEESQDSDYSKEPATEESANLFSEAKYTHEELLEALSKLPESHRIVFNMYHVEDFSHAEIAAALQIGEKTSRSRLFRAKRTLQEHLQLIANRSIKLSKI